MKELISILFIGGIFIGGINPSGFAQNEVTESYFHNLKGLEDSAGTTHLFYRLYQNFDEDYEMYEDKDCILWENDVYHFDLQANLDSLKYESFRQLRCEMFDDPIYTVQDFQFPYKDLSKEFLATFSRGIYDNHFGRARTYNGSFFDAGGASINKFEIVLTDTMNFGIYDFWESSILIVLNNDSLPSIRYPYIMLVKASEAQDPELYCPNGEDGNCFYGRSDSVLIYGQNFLSVDQHQQGGLYFQRNDSLFWSDDLGTTMNFRNNTFLWSSMDVFLYGENNSTLIAATRFKYEPLNEYFSLETGPDSTDYYQLLKSTDNGHTWEEVFGDSNKIYVSQTLDENGTFYAGNKQTVYEANNYGETFSELLTFDHPITGLYKKPDSDLLYVLTKEELLEVNVGTKETTSLKKLPVSNEPKPSEIPNQISLEQNYPNPFNPSTVISYRLVENSLVQLEVFDVTGRKVAVLMDGKPQMAGAHQVRFDAHELSSGVYFYRLETNGKTLTKKMLLMK